LAITGAEHVPSLADHVADPKEADRRPQPGVGGEFTPALAQLAEEACPGDILGTRGQTDRADQGRAHKEGGGVGGEGEAGAAGDDERSADRRTEHEDEVAREALQRVCLLQSRWADGLGHETDLGRDHEAVPEAIGRLQRHQRKDGRIAREHQQRRQRLRSSLEQRGADEDVMARQSVRDDTAADEDGGADRLARSEDDAEVGRRAAGKVEHREGEGDVGDGVPGRRDRRRGEEQAEGALDQRAEPAGQGAHAAKRTNADLLCCRSRCCVTPSTQRRAAGDARADPAGRGWRAGLHTQFGCSRHGLSPGGPDTRVPFELIRKGRRPSRRRPVLGSLSPSTATSEGKE